MVDLNKQQNQLEERLGSMQKIDDMSEITLQNNESLEALKVIYPGMKNREVLNAFRDIRTKLMQKAGDDNFVVMVTPVCNSGGGSFFSVNLAAAIALDRGKSALVVDCNLYQPSLHNIIPNETDLGLSQFLEDGSIKVEEIVYATGVNRLRVIPVGTGHEPALELFTSERMKHFIAEIKNRYPDRYIILDVPPITESADARIIQEFSDYCLVVLPYGKVSKSQVLSSVDAVIKDKLAGVVLNDF